MVKTVAAFCPCPKSLPEAKLKSFGLIAFAEEISKELSVNSVLWLAVARLGQICNEKEQAEQRKFKRNMHIWRRKGEPGSVTRLKKNRINEVGTDLRARSHLVMLPTCEKKN